MNAPVRPPLHGEVIAPDDRLGVLAFMHPLKSTYELVLVPVGASFAEIVDACEQQCNVSRLAEGARVTWNGEIVPREVWHLIRPKKGQHITVRAVAGDFIITPIIAAVSTALSLSPFVTSLLTVAASFLLKLAISSLFPPASTKAEKVKTLYSISGLRNEVAKWEPVPAILGRIRAAPKYAASPVTEIIGDDQYIRMLFVWGIGPIDIADIKIGETPIDDYDDVEIETRNGYADDDPITLYTGQTVETTLSINPQQNEAVERDTAEEAIEIQIDLVAPQGIFRQSDSGSFKSYEVKLRIDYKLASAPSSAYALFSNVSFKGDSQDPIRRTFRKKVASGQYSVRVTRLSQNPEQEPRKGVAVNWVALRTLRKAKAIDFPLPLALTAIRIRATDQLNGTPDNLNAILQTRGKRWNGSQWLVDTKAARVTTRNPGDLMRHVLQGAANKRPSPDSKIDLPMIQAFSDYCRAKGFNFDMNRDFRASVWDTLRDVAAAGRGVPLYRDGIWSAAWERTNAPIVQHFTPRNSWNMRRKIEYKAAPDALRCKFLNADKAWIEDEILVFPVGSTKNKNTPNLQTELAEFPGVTDKATIVKLARYRMAEGALRPATFTLSSDLDHLRCTRGDRVYIAYDTLMNTGGMPGRVKSVSGQTVTLDTPVTMAPGVTYGIRFRRANNDSLLRTVVTNPGIQTVITLAGSGSVPSGPNTGSAGDMWSFGPLGQEAGVFRLREIHHNDDLSAELELVDDAPTIEDADDQPIPDYDSGLVAPIDISQFPPTNLRVVETLEVKGSKGTYVATLSFDTPTLAGMSYFTGIATNADGNSVRSRRRADGRELRFVDLDPGVWSFAVYIEYADRRPSKRSASISQKIVGSNAYPDDVDTLKLNAVGQNLTLSWNAPAGPVASYQVRYSPKTTGVLWDKMSSLQKSVKVPTLQTKLRDGTYAVKAVGFGGKQSRTAAFAVVVNSGIVGINVISTISEPGTFSGAKAQTVVEAGELRLTFGGNIFGVADVFALPDAFTPGGETSYSPSGTYLIPGSIDLGAVYTSALSPQIDARGTTSAIDVFNFADVFEPDDVFGFDSSDWDATIQISTTQVDPALSVWSEYQDLDAGDITARAMRFRLLLESMASGVTPRVSSASIVVDMPDRSVAGKDISVPTAGLAVAFTPPFKELRGISIAAQDMASGDRYTITSKGRSGFTIRFFNSAGTAVARTFDYTAIGYGVSR